MLNTGADKYFVAPAPNPQEMFKKAPAPAPEKMLGSNAPGSSSGSPALALRMSGMEVPSCIVVQSSCQLLGSVVLRSAVALLSLDELT